MKIPYFLLIMTWLITPIAQSSEFDQFDDLVHIIKTKTNGKGTTVSRGTGFVVGLSGKIITNYHVVSSIFKKGKVNKKYKIYVKIKGKQYQAKILKFDILADLALLEVPVKFENTVSISSSKINKGDKIYALGFHDKEFLAINQGIFNDHMKDDENKLMALSVPLNGGMSGGPVLNAALEVIGVNVMKHSGKESAGYGVNREKLISFLQYDVVDRKKNKTLEAIMTAQVRKSYGRVMASIKNTSKSQLLNEWKTPNMDHFLICGEYDREINFNNDEDDKDADQILAKYKNCWMDHRKIPMSALGGSVDMSYAIANIQGSKNTRNLTYYNYINSDFRFSSYRNIFRKDKYSCNKDYYQNSHGVTFKISICALKYEIIPTYLKTKNLYKFSIKAVTITPEMDDIIIKLQFSGVPRVAKTIINNLFDKVYKPQQERSVAGE